MRRAGGDAEGWRLMTEQQRDAAEKVEIKVIKLKVAKRSWSWWMLSSSYNDGDDDDSRASTQLVSESLSPALVFSKIIDSIRLAAGGLWTFSLVIMVNRFCDYGSFLDWSEVREQQTNSDHTWTSSGCCFISSSNRTSPIAALGNDQLGPSCCTQTKLITLTVCNKPEVFSYTETQHLKLICFVTQSGSILCLILRLEKGSLAERHAVLLDVCLPVVSTEAGAAPL